MTVERNKNLLAAAAAALEPEIPAESDREGKDEAQATGERQNYITYHVVAYKFMVRGRWSRVPRAV